MQKIGRLWFADWRDDRGQRLRKGFRTQRAALSYQHKMKRETVTTKKAHASGASVRSPRRGARRTASRSTPASPRVSSAKSPGTSRSRN